MIPLTIHPRYRPDTGRYVVLWRPPRFKKQLSLGTYMKEEDALIACDVCTFHAAEEEKQQLAHEHFNYRCSLELFATRPPLSIKFSSLKPDCAGKLHCTFSDEIRERTKLWIQHNERFHWTEWTELRHWVSDGNKKMPEDAPLDDWSAQPDLDIVKKYPELSNQHRNLPSHVTGLAGFELTVLDDMNRHEGGQNLHISSTLDDPCNISEESMEACHMVCWERS
ncbi:unnamed protein product [Sphagnum balticum]